MNDLQIFIDAIVKIAKENWPILAYIIVGLAVLARSEKLEKKRLVEVIKRQNARRSNDKKYIA